MALVHEGEPLDMAQLIAIETNRLREQRSKLREALFYAKRVIPIHTPEWEQARAALEETDSEP